jgi:hypothetical protein
MFRCVALVRTEFVLLRSMCRWLVTVNAIPTSQILVTLMLEALSSSELSVLTRATRRNIPDDATLETGTNPNARRYNSRNWPLVTVYTYIYIEGGGSVQNVNI